MKALARLTNRRSTKNGSTDDGWIELEHIELVEDWCITLAGRPFCQSVSQSVAVEDRLMLRRACTR